MNEQDKNNLHTLLTHLVNGNKVFLDEKAISVKDKGDRWMLNYIQGGGRNEFNRLVRGMVVGKPDMTQYAYIRSGRLDVLSFIESFPFSRFFNRAESDAAVVDLANSDMIEKLDGTMVGVFFPDGNFRNPQWHTRKMVSTNPDDLALKITTLHGGQYRLLELIGEYVKKLHQETFDSGHTSAFGRAFGLGTNYTFVFEFIHEASFVWTKYQPEQYGLYLIGARELWGDFRELSEKELDDVGNQTGIRRPRIMDAVTDEAAIMESMKKACSETSGFEGFVFRDRLTGNRIKLKDEDYVKFHHMIDRLTSKNLVSKVLEGEGDEIVAYFPSARERIDKILSGLSRLVETVSEQTVLWNSKGLTRKEVALSVFDEKLGLSQFVRSKIMGYYGKNATRDTIAAEVDAELRVMGDKSPKRFLEVIGVNDDVAEVDVEQ